MRPKPSTLIALGLPLVLALTYVCVVVNPSRHTIPPAVQVTAQDSAETWKRCTSLFQEGRYQEVLPELSKLLEAHPGNHIYLEMAAQVYGRLGDHQREADYWEKYFDHAPNPVTACPQIGQAYQKLGRAKEATAAFERCLARDPANADSIFFLGHALERSGQPERAAELYTRGLEIAPEYSDMQIGLARLQLLQGKVQQAKRTLMPTLNRTPPNPDALLVAGLVLRREGDLAGAKRYLQRGLQLSDGYVDIHMILADIAEQEKNYPVAIREYDRILHLQPDDQTTRAKRDALRDRQ